MAERNLAGKTYDVLTLNDGRWLISTSHGTRSAALDAAETLLGGDVEGVRVVAESERTGDTEVIFEQVVQGGGKKVAIVPIDEAPLCGTLADVYALPARRAVGRLLRRHLDVVVRAAIDAGYVEERAEMAARPGRSGGVALVLSAEVPALDGAVFRRRPG